MNIFVLDLSPTLAAQYQCDKHVVKMVLESTQLLSNAYPDGMGPYRRTHMNHPCSLWARECFENWMWLAFHADALCKEYTFRYKKLHKCHTIVGNMILNPPFIQAIGNKTPFVQAMPEEYKNADPVVAYRNYYMGAKYTIAKWDKGREKPHWYNSLSL